MILILLFITYVTSIFITFDLYAPPMTYGTWYHGGDALAGNFTVKIEVDPSGSTTAYCELECQGFTHKFIDTLTCKWTSEAVGYPNVRCYGNPTGSYCKVYQTTTPYK